SGAGDMKGHTMWKLWGGLAALGVVGALSAGGGALAAAQAVPANTAPPTITGTTTVGHTLTATDGTWTNRPTSFTYQWQRCDADIAACTNVIGETAKTYALTAADVGYRIRVEVTAHNSSGATRAPSAITTIVQPAVPITNHRPTLRIISVVF